MEALIVVVDAPPALFVAAGVYNVVNPDVVGRAQELAGPLSETQGPVNAPTRMSFELALLSPLNEKVSV
ncbi:hypothetical protein [Burkholderia sp. PAMC 26561]|uniref:hypothetical protein n=1 Tax=Burkholderia sp. PAMC 26561 TaxID=1795043 RepID=UPI0013C40F8C|nr:hypothetical protein [Burkholderia sp. PAMC 26561]